MSSPFPFVRIGREYKISCAHMLPKVSSDHPCHSLHGHNYRIEVIFAGEIDPNMGWLLDFHEVDRHVKPIMDLLDHRQLNSIEGLENPTVEILAHWILERLEHGSKFAVRVWETDRCYAEARNTEGKWPRNA